MRIGITIPVYITNTFLAHKLANALASTKIGTDKQKEDYEIVRLGVINRLDAPYKEFITSQFDHVFFNDENIVAKAWNIGIIKLYESYDCDYVFVLNQDIIITLDYIDRIVNFAKKNKGLCYSGHDQNGYHPKSLNFCAFMVTEDMLETVGLFDENFIPAYYEDNDMHRRLILGGYNSYCVEGAYYDHEGSMTIKTDSDAMRSNADTFPKNRSYYISKWGGQPGEETYLTPFNK